MPLDNLDGLLLSGGADLNPTLYHRDRDPACGDPDDTLDSLEMELLGSALKRDLPVLAICRGMQLFNVWHGGTLRQHVEGHRQPGVAEAHRVVVEPGARLADAIGAGPHIVNSRHHQVVEEVGRGLRVSARSEDGYAEGLERGDRRFAVAVQWHPEDLVDSPLGDSQDDARRLFLAFAGSL
jgi:gamma-glutamyl-gamma-aminobutyrate hydrolase PuuD